MLRDLTRSSLTQQGKLRVFSAGVMKTVMRLDQRLSRVLHVLLHLDRFDVAATSETLAGMLDTNPVVVRRMMSGLREAGLVRSEKGHGGGWTLARGLGDITLLDVHRALGTPTLFAIGLADEDPRCLVEQAVNATLSAALQDAEALLMRRFAEVSLHDIAKGFDERWAKCLPAREQSH